MTDPITIEVVRHKLEGIANEMQSTLLRSSFSQIVKEGLDASSGLFTADGHTLAQASDGDCRSSWWLVAGRHILAHGVAAPSPRAR